MGGKSLTSSSGSGAGVTRWVDGGALDAVQAPLTPRPRGTIYEALPFYLQMFLEGTRLSAYLNSSHFIIDGERSRCVCIVNSIYMREDMALLAAIKVIEYRDADYETAKKEVAGYFLMVGKAYASDASSDLELDYELVCKIMDDLELDGQMEISL